MIFKFFEPYRKWQILDCKLHNYGAQLIKNYH